MQNVSILASPSLLSGRSIAISGGSRDEARRMIMRTTFVTALLLVALPVGALAMDHMAVQPNALKWGPSPPGLPPGAQVSVVAGDPGKDGPYVIRAKLPSGYKIPPHFHPTAENVTVL